MTTYYVRLKSCSNVAEETQVFEAPSPLVGAEVVIRARVSARSWGLANGSDAVQVSVENYTCGCIVPQHVVDVF